MSFHIGDRVRLVKVLSSYAENTKRHLRQVGTVQKINDADLYGTKYYVEFDGPIRVWVRGRFLEAVD